MNAVAFQLDDGNVTGNEIRKKLCDHIKEHKDVKFLSTATAHRWQCCRGCSVSCD